MSVSEQKVEKCGICGADLLKAERVTRLSVWLAEGELQKGPHDIVLNDVVFACGQCSDTLGLLLQKVKAIGQKAGATVLREWVVSRDEYICG